LADLGVKTYDQLRAVVAPPARPTTRRSGAASPARSADDAARQARILRFWRSVELFGAQKLDPPDPRERRYQVRAGQPLPWQDGHPLHGQPLREDLVWRHVAYGGLFALDGLHAALERVFGDSGADVDERIPRGTSAVFAGVVTQDGRLLLDSLVLSQAAWALGRAHNPGPSADGWLDGFTAAADRFAAAAREVVAAAEDDPVARGLAEDGVAVSRPIDQPALLALAGLAVDLVGVGEVLAPDGLRVHSGVVSRKRAHDAQADFLNSFYADDLARIADAVTGGDCGEALAAMLTADEALPQIHRVDVRDPAVADLLLEQLAPARTPAGRWPAAVGHPLATSQQLAINTMVQRLGGQAGLFAVNGPPGTGKTTMLRDLIAALVVERASRLADLPYPAAGFEDQRLAWRTDHSQRWVRPLRPELTGFEIVVASANNGAVANVTQEIPQRAAIDDTWAAQADYFADHATRVLGEPAWGLVAARLGNKTNCGEFVSRFWYGDPADPGKKPGAEGPGFHEWLAAPTATGGAADWMTTVASFRTAVDAERRLREARQHAHDVLRQLPALRRSRHDAEQECDAAGQARRLAEAAAEQADQAARAASQSAETARARRREHRAAKPGVWEILFTAGRAIRRWHTEDEPLARAVADAESAERRTATAAQAARRAAADGARRVTAAAVARERAADALAAADQVVADVRAEVGDCLPDTAWRSDPIRRELAGPWLDEAWNAARTRVFLAALDLHAAFVAGAAASMRTNLQVAMDVLTGQAPNDVAESVLRQAWQALFLVIPVVSTTFASVGRLLGRLGREALGWLLIDEAGQAAPQAAVGAIWRARRVVAVGDPLQLEPVVTVLHTTQVALARHHDVADAWLPGRVSVQALADRVSSLGTWLPGPDDGRVWVGAPLRVHRRCEDPMFTIVNTAVYGGLMIHGTMSRPQPLTVTDSAWIDVSAGDADGHWIPAEGDAVVQILDYLCRHDVDPAQIMAISPFRDTARHMGRLLARRYPRLLCGTVHTAQGKERECILFVLGGNPARPGALRWAASQPNLLNVAVSRARQRLYVVGNHDSWAKLPYFSVLARTLPVRPLRTSG
jgi:hypothetical protein